MPEIKVSLLGGRSSVRTACGFLTAVLISLLLLAGCSAGGALSGVSVTPSGEALVPGSSGAGNPPGAVDIRYTLGSDAPVSVMLQGPRPAVLLKERQSAGEHVLRFNGVIDASEQRDGYRVSRRALPPGDYTVVVAAGDAAASAPLRVGGGEVDPPSIANVVLHPDLISPNSDAVDDVAELTFRTAQTTTISLDLGNARGERVPVLAPIKKGPGEQNVVVTGETLDGGALPDGVYTATLRVRDRQGNIVEAERHITVQGSGKPSIEVVKVEISPRQIMIGKPITVSITVKNTGNVPLRTQGPDPGYIYTTNDSYSSIEGGQWVDRAGLWRVGVDWDGNSGGAGPYRYPFRWGLSKTLMPGETATTGGQIVVLKQERTMWFYAGVLQEGIRIVLDRLGRTRVDVGF